VFPDWIDYEELLRVALKVRAGGLDSLTAEERDFYQRARAGLQPAFEELQRVLPLSDAVDRFVEHLGLDPEVFDELTPAQALNEINVLLYG
jgi:hypothetical protein